MVTLFLCSTQLKATQGNTRQHKATKVIDVFNQPTVDSFFFGHWQWCCQVEGRCVCEASRGWRQFLWDWGCWLLDKDRGRLPEESTGNEIWIDQIYLLSVHFNKVRYQSSGVPPNGCLPQEHSVRNGTRHRPWQRTRRVTSLAQGLSVLMGVKEWGSLNEKVGGFDRLWSDKVLIFLPFTNTLSSGVHGWSSKELTFSCYWLLCIQITKDHLDFLFDLNSGIMGLVQLLVVQRFRGRNLTMIREV